MTQKLMVEQILEWSGFLDRTVGPVFAKRMFGGYGIYCGEAMFALVANGVAYFKSDEKNRADYESAGGEPFRYEKRSGKVAVMSFFTIPDAAWDSEARFRPWARTALDAASRALARRRKK